MKLTEEQQKIINYFQEDPDGRENIRIMAYAGAGKTFILLRIAETLSNKSILNLSFNKAIKDHANTCFPRNTKNSTFHGMALYAAKRHIGDIQIAGNNNTVIRSIMDICGVKYNLARLINGVICDFCETDDEVIQRKHAYSEKMKERLRPALLYSYMAEEIYQCARKVWHRLHSNPLEYPIPHNVYLKWFALADDVELGSYDLIIVDEAQDSNPCMLHILKKLNNRVVVVGDPFQQIYEFNGAVNALERTKYRPFYLTKSFRWGESVADFSNNILKLSETYDPEHPVRGLETKNTVVEASPGLYGMPSEMDAIICRMNRDCFYAAKYCLQEAETPIPYTLVGKETMIREYKLLMGFWRGNNKIEGFDTWEELELYIKETDSTVLPYAWMVELISKNNAWLGEVLENSEEDGSGVQIMTTHAAKGKEWPRVCVYGSFLPTYLPGREEELRIFYVACTRASEHLTVVIPNNLPYEALTTYGNHLKKWRQSPMNVKIVCAALRIELANEVTQVVPGLHHAEITEQLSALGITYKEYEIGFVTSTGEFVDQMEAAEIAFKSGQIQSRYRNEALQSTSLY